MVIGGRCVMPFKRPKGTKPVPRNARAVGVARETIEALGPTMQATLQNAITGDGRLCLLYMPKTSGVKCTCSNSDPLDVNGKMLPEVMASLLASNGIQTEDYGPLGVSRRDPAKLLDADPSSIDNTNIKYPDASPKFGSEGFTTKTFTIDDLDSDDFDPDNYDINLDDAIDERPVPSLQNGYVPTQQASTTSCPICLGIGWVGGYDLYGGTRQVFAASSATSYNGCELIDGTPDYVKMPKGSSIEFAKVMLPAGATRIDEVALWNDRSKVPYRLWVDDIEQTFATIGNCFDGRPHRIKISPMYNTEVTHVTFQYGVTEILADVSKDVVSTNNSVYDQQNPVTIVIPVITGKEIKGAIVYDSTDDKYYRVGTVNTSHTQGGYVQNLDLDGRTVQPYELAMLLPKMNLKKIKKFGGSFGHTSHRPRNF